MRVTVVKIDEDFSQVDAMWHASNSARARAMRLGSYVVNRFHGRPNESSRGGVVWISEVLSVPATVRIPDLPYVVVQRLKDSSDAWVKRARPGTYATPQCPVRKITKGIQMAI